MLKLHTPDEADGEQCTTDWSDPENPVMVPVIGGHCRTKGSDRVHASSRQNSSETIVSTLTPLLLIISDVNMAR